MYDNKVLLCKGTILAPAEVISGHTDGTWS